MWVQQGGMDGNYEESYGNDIYVPYTNRPFDEQTNTYQQYGFRIGGNGKLNRVRFSMEMDYPIFKKWNLHAFAKPAIELQSGFANDTIFIFFAGIKSNLWNERSFRF